MADGAGEGRTEVVERGGIDTLGGRLLAAREMHDVSLGELHKRAGVSKTYLIQLEHNRKANPGLETVTRVAQALGIDPAWLAFGRR